MGIDTGRVVAFGDLLNGGSSSDSVELGRCGPNTHYGPSVSGTEITDALRQHIFSPQYFGTVRHVGFQFTTKRPGIGSILPIIFGCHLEVTWKI